MIEARETVDFYFDGLPPGTAPHEAWSEVKILLHEQRAALHKALVYFEDDTPLARIAGMATLRSALRAFDSAQPSVS